MLCTNTRFAVFTLLLLLLLVNTANSQTTPTPTPTPDETVRVETEEIKINVLAFDANKKFVDNVRIEDLVITENDVLHQATSLRRIPANVVIVMDTGGELRLVKTIDQTRKTASALVAALQPTAAVAIVQFSDTAEVVSGLTTDRAATAAAIGRTNFGLGSDFVEAIRLATEMLTRTGVENRHVVFITDGTGNSTAGSARTNAMRRLLETDINVHVISYTRLEAAAAERFTRNVNTRPQSATEGPTGMPREMAELLPNGARDSRTAPRIGPTINLDRRKTATWRRRKADLESSEAQMAVITESANGMMVIPSTLEEMIEQTPALARVIDASFVLTYMPKIPLNEKKGDRVITVNSKRAGLVVQGKRTLVVKKTP